ncbi:MAG TPA: alpha/beta fold hydrolase, partial [Myxococcota bacterium]|nr:alpha/beta fold hydrolase [Myxococcota bacterium]
MASVSREPHTIEIAANGFRFRADVAGEAGAPLVLLLNGFPQTKYTWRHQLPAFAAAGYRALAPDQRGYSPGA